MNSPILVRSRADTGRLARIVLIVGDALALLSFAAGGLAAHDLPLDPFPAVTLVAIAAPFGVPWFILAWLWGVFRRDTLRQPGQMLLRTAIAWLSAGPMGLVARTLILQRPLPPSFAAVALGVPGAMLLGWHLAVSLIRSFQTVSESEG